MILTQKKLRVINSNKLMKIQKPEKVTYANQKKVESILLGTTPGSVERNSHFSVPCSSNVLSHFSRTKILKKGRLFNSAGGLYEEAKKVWGENYHQFCYDYLPVIFFTDQKSKLAKTIVNANDTTVLLIKKNLQE